PSAARIPSKALIASGNQNECSIATALLNSGWSGGTHEVSNFTLALPTSSGAAAPCASCCAKASAGSDSRLETRRAIRRVIEPAPCGGPEGPPYFGSPEG